MVDKDENLYIAGLEEDLNLGWLMAKYDSSGSIIWSKHNDSGFEIFPAGIAVDSNGNIYTAVTYLEWTENVLTTSKYDPFGNMIWARNYAPPDYRDYYGSVVILDKDGNVLVGGGIGSSTSVPDPVNPGFIVLPRTI